MKKISYSMILFFFMFFLLTVPANAHTGLESSVPAEGEVIQEALQEIVLTFEGKIEKTSSFSLINEKGDEMPVQNITVTDRQLTGTVEGIPNGAYIIEWNIIGADGHPIQGVIPFGQDAENVPESIDDEQTSEETQASTDVSEEESSNAWVYYVLFAVMIVVLAFLLGRWKR